MTEDGVPLGHRSRGCIYLLAKLPLWGPNLKGLQIGYCQWGTGLLEDRTYLAGWFVAFCSYPQQDGTRKAADNGTTKANWPFSLNGNKTSGWSWIINFFLSAENSRAGTTLWCLRINLRCTLHWYWLLSEFMQGQVAWAYFYADCLFLSPSDHVLCLVLGAADLVCLHLLIGTCDEPAQN